MTPAPYTVWPDRAHLRELRRPWKLLTLAGGMAWLLYGALFHGIGDWDVGVSLIMGGLTYLLAPWSVLLIRNALVFRPAWWPAHVALALAAAVLVVDTSYMTYHGLVGNPTDREGNFRASIALYFLAGVPWAYRGSLRELAAGVRAALR